MVADDVIVVTDDVINVTASRFVLVPSDVDDGSVSWL